MSSRKRYRSCAHSPSFGECRPDGALTPPPGISEVPSVGTESDSVPKDSVNPPSKIESCTCGAEGRAHKRGCPLNTGAQGNPSKQEPGILLLQKI